MTDDFNEKIAKAALGREDGMSEESKEELQAKLESMDDWYATCPFCKEKCTGTLAQMRAHKCPDL